MESAVSRVVRALTKFGTDQGKVKPFCVGWTINVSAVKRIGSCAEVVVRSQCSTADPGKCLESAESGKDAPSADDGL